MLKLGTIALALGALATRKLAACSFLAVCTCARIVVSNNQLSLGVAAQVNCSESRSLHSQDELDEVRKECKELGGYLALQSNWTGDANLDGIERIDGNLMLFYCDNYVSTYSGCLDASDRPFSVHSSTLKEVTGYIDKQAGSAPVKSIRFPKLQTVGLWFGLSDQGTLEELDLTALTDVGGFQVTGASKLKSIENDGIRNLTCVRDNTECSVMLNNVNDLKFVKSLLAKDLSPSDTHDNQSLALEVTWSDGDGEVENMNFTWGWKNISHLLVSRKQVWIDMGVKKTENMFIGEADLRLDTRLERSDSLKSLEVGHAIYEATKDDEDVETIKFPFDKVKDLTVRVEPYTEVTVEHIGLPKEAKYWDMVNITMEMHRTKFDVKDGDGNALWTWPREANNIRLSGKIGMNLL